MNNIEGTIGCNIEACNLPKVSRSHTSFSPAPPVVSMADAAPEEVEPNEDDAAAGNEGYSSESIKEEHDEANKLDAGA